MLKVQEKEALFPYEAVNLCTTLIIITEAMFLNIALNLSCTKIKRLYNQCLNIGAMAA